MTATAFSQRDPRWAGDVLGTCETLTIGAAGCLICCVASMLVDFGTPTDPHRLNAWLRSHWGYIDGCRFVWRSVAGLGAELIELVQCATVPAPTVELAEALRRGEAVIVRVDNEPGAPVESHYLRLLHFEERDVVVMDPWQLPGSEVGSLLARYSRPGWDAARVILAAGVYRKDGRQKISFAPGDATAASVHARGPM